MLTRCLLAVLSLAATFVLPIAGQEEGDVRSIDLPTPWKVGNEYDLTVEKGTRFYRNGKLEKDGSGITKYLVEVLRAGEHGFVLRWTIRSIDTPGESELAIEVARISLGMAMEMRTDEYGTVVKLLNGPEIRRVGRKTAAALRKKLVAAGVEEKVVQAALAPVMETLLAEENELLLLELPRMFTMPSGGSFVLGEDVEYEDQLPFPFTGQSIPTQAAFRLEAIDDAAGTALVKWRQTLDPEKAKEVIQTFLDQTAAGMGKDPGPLDGFRFDVRDEAEFLYDLTTGIPRTAKFSRDADMGEGRRVDWWRITTGPLR